MALLFKYLPVSKTKICNDPQIGYVLLFTSYILLVPEPTSMDVQINSDLNIKTRNHLIYECTLGLFFQITSTQNSKTYQRFCLSSRTQQCLFLVSAFVLNSIQIAPLLRTTQHIFCRYEKKGKYPSTILLLESEMFSHPFFFKSLYVYHKEIIDYQPFTTLCMSYASCALPIQQTEINKCCY